MKFLLNSCCLLLENNLRACLVHVGLCVTVLGVFKGAGFLEGAGDQPLYAQFSA